VFSAVMDIRMNQCWKNYSHCFAVNAVTHDVDVNVIFSSYKRGSQEWRPAWKKILLEQFPEIPSVKSQRKIPGVMT